MVPFVSDRLLTSQPIPPSKSILAHFKETDSRIPRRALSKVSHSDQLIPLPTVRLL
jgi:hypothetical protein